jgi:hypothetical protein
MATAKMDAPSSRTDSFVAEGLAERPKLSKTRPRNIEAIEAISWDAAVHPNDYQIQGTHPDSKILFLGVNIIDSTGREPYSGDVLIEGMLFIARARSESRLRLQQVNVSPTWEQSPTSMSFPKTAKFVSSMVEAEP